MNALGATLHRPVRAEPPPRTQVGGVQARLQNLVERQVPRLAEAALALRQEVRWRESRPLAAALQAHLNALGALRFELLVSPGLRAAPRERDEAAFRRQVTTVSECTEATWLAIRRFMEDRPGGGTEALAADFSVELRAIHRQVSEEARACEARQEHLVARLAATQAPAALQAIEELRERNSGARSVLERLQALCETGRPAQSSAFQLAQQQVVLRASMKRLAARLSGSLLECLRVLVCADVSAPAEELRNAQQARGEIQDALSQALADLVRVHSCSEDLLVWLGAVGHRVAALPSQAQ